MSQENENIESEIWSWQSDCQGRISSISSGFSVYFGLQGAKKILGYYFWTFADGLEKAEHGWRELESAFQRHKKIRKFIFNYRYQGQVVKVALTGDPIFDKGRYLGHKGQAYIARDDEISIPEITQNIASTAINTLNIGIAIFSRDTGLLEYNHHFIDQMSGAKVKIANNMTFETFITYLKAQGIFHDALSYETSEYAKFYFEQSDHSLIILNKINLNNRLFIIKSEIDNSLANIINNYKANIKKLKQNNNLLEKRVVEYKDQISSLLQNKSKSVPSVSNFERLLSFYENNLDIGILVSDSDGTIENANYFIAHIFGFVTAAMVMINKDNIEFNRYFDERQERIKELMANSVNRFENIISLNNYIHSGDLKEVITFYPSVHNPKKVISLFYPINISSDLDKPQMDEKDNLYKKFICHMIDDIKSSVTVINGYNELNQLEHNHKDDNDYNIKINESCHTILSKISDVMQAYKISSNIQNFEKSVFSIQEIFSICQKNTSLYNNVHFSLPNYQEELFVISDRTLLCHALQKVITVMHRACEENTILSIKALENIEVQEIHILIENHSHFNISQISQSDTVELFDNQKDHSFGELSYKIAERYLTVLGCDITAEYYEDTGNYITITLSDDMIISKHERDENNVVV